MRISELRQKYNKLAHNLHDLEKTIISLRGELKWSPSVLDSQFKEYDGALIERDHLEEELYELDLMIRKGLSSDSSYRDCNNVILFPKRSIN